MKKIKKFLPDILIIVGIWILSYNLLRPVVGFGRVIVTDYHTEWKVFGIVLIAIGVDIFVRRYLIKK